MHGLSLTRTVSCTVRTVRTSGNFTKADEKPLPGAISADGEDALDSVVKHHAFIC